MPPAARAGCSCVTSGAQMCRVMCWNIIKRLQLACLLPMTATCATAEEGSRESVDAGCRNLTAPWVRDKAQSDASVQLCDYFEDLENAGPEVCRCFVRFCRLHPVPPTFCVKS